jgi:hypothetical protein
MAASDRQNPLAANCQPSAEGRSRGDGALLLANASAAAVPARAPVRHQMSGGKPSSTACTAAHTGSADPQSPELAAPLRSKARATVQPRNFGQLSVYRVSLAFISRSSSADAGLLRRPRACLVLLSFPFTRRILPPGLGTRAR